MISGADRKSSSSSRSSTSCTAQNHQPERRRRRRDPLEQLTPREREVLALIAEGKSNGAIAKELVVSEAAIGKHIGNILTKLDLPPTARTHRRVLAVLTYLRA